MLFFLNSLIVKYYKIYSNITIFNIVFNNNNSNNNNVMIFSKIYIFTVKYHNLFYKFYLIVTIIMIMMFW